MSTETNHIIDPQAEADMAEAQRLFEAGLPFPPELSKRIQERAEKLRQETFQRVGYLSEETVNRLVRDDER